VGKSQKRQYHAKSVKFVGKIFLGIYCREGVTTVGAKGGT
jgi:hypothetical protein